MLEQKACSTALIMLRSGIPYLRRLPDATGSCVSHDQNAEGISSISSLISLEVN